MRSWSYSISALLEVYAIRRAASTATSSPSVKSAPAGRQGHREPSAVPRRARTVRRPRAAGTRIGARELGARRTPDPRPARAARARPRGRDASAGDQDVRSVAAIHGTLLSSVGSPTASHAAGPVARRASLQRRAQRRVEGAAGGWPHVPPAGSGRKTRNRRPPPRNRPWSGVQMRSTPSARSRSASLSCPCRSPLSRPASPPEESRRTEGAPYIRWVPRARRQGPRREQPSSSACGTSPKTDPLARAARWNCLKYTRRASASRVSASPVGEKDPWRGGGDEPSDDEEDCRCVRVPGGCAGGRPTTAAKDGDVLVRGA